MEDRTLMRATTISRIPTKPRFMWIYFDSENVYLASQIQFLRSCHRVGERNAAVDYIFIGFTFFCVSLNMRDDMGILKDDRCLIFINVWGTFVLTSTRNRN
jgi:hypothetical protein